MMNDENYFSDPEKHYSIFRMTNIEHDFNNIVFEVLRHWAAYLSDFHRAYPEEPLPYEDNEMSATGSLASALARFDPRAFAIHEARQQKRLNKTESGRCDLLVYLPEDKRLIVEAKVKSEVPVHKLGQAFVADESADGRDWSLVGRGFRDYAKSYGTRSRIRRKADGNHLMLLMTTVRQGPLADIESSTKEMFNTKCRVRKVRQSDDLPASGTQERTTQKDLRRYSSFGFIFKPESEDLPALVATATLL